MQRVHVALATLVSAEYLLGLPGVLLDLPKEATISQQAVHFPLSPSWPQTLSNPPVAVPERWDYSHEPSHQLHYC